MKPFHVDRHLLDRFRDELEELTSLSNATRTWRSPVELDQQSVDRLSRMDAMQAQATALDVEARRRRRIGAIAAALNRAADGEFGFCLTCVSPS